MPNLTLDITELNERFETAHPREALRWAFENVERFAIAASFQLDGLTMVHMAREFTDRVPVLFIQTGFHFPETIEYRDSLVADWNLELIETTPTLGPARQAREIHPELYAVDPDRCCELNKVLPLQKVLETLDGWATGVRRDQSVVRADVPIVERQTLPSGRDVLKLNPLARWTKQDTWHYARRYDIPRHPLYERDYLSIGCAPCTRAVTDGEDERSGRWNGGKLECGIHTFGGTAQEAALNGLA